MAVMAAAVDPSGANQANPHEEIEGEGLRRLGRSVTGCIWEDCRLPDPFEVINQGSVGRDDSSPHLPETFKDGLIKLSKLIVIPEVLISQYTERSKCFMGLVGEIGRAWMTIDDRLYLWDFRTGRDLTCWQEPLTSITGQSSTGPYPIIDVRLVKPKPGVFVEAISWLLAIVTPVQVRLLGVQVTDDLILHDANLSFSTDGITMLSVTGFPDGRLFVGGSDGHIYELEYAAEEGWFTRRCRKINRTGSLLSKLAPTFLKSASSATPNEMAIVDLCPDPSRGLLWVLRENSQLELYRTLNSSFEHLQTIHFSPEGPLRFDATLLPSSVGNRLIGIHPVGKEQSTKLGLLAVTSTGMRLYYNVEGSQGQLSSVKPPSPLSSGLKSCGKDRLNMVFLANSLTSVHSSGQSDGLYVSAGALNTDEDIFVIKHMLLEHHCEVSSEWKLEGRVWDVDFASTSFISSPNCCSTWWNEIVHGHESLTKQILCLTNAGIYVFEKERPVDTLARLLTASAGSSEDENLTIFFNKFLPTDQAIAQALILATKPSNLSFWATQVILRQPAAARQMGCLRYFGRLMGESWKRPVQTLQNPKIDQILPLIRSLHNFLQSNPASSSPEMTSLVTLVGRTAELLAFLGICLDYQLDMISVLQAYDASLGIDLELLVSSPSRGPLIVKALGSALVKQQLHLQASVDSLCAVLLDRCPSYFSPADALLFEGNDYLTRAIRSSNQNLKEQLLDESLHCFLKATPSASLETLGEVLTAYRKVHYFKGILTLGQTNSNLYEKLLDCFEDLLQPLPEAEAIFEASLGSTCPISFRVTFCDWLFSKSIAGAVLLGQTSSSPDIIEYLQTGAFKDEFLISRAKADALWKYLAKHGDSAEAGKVLVKLSKSITKDASLDNLALPLADRIQYLSMAVATLKANSVPTGEAEDTLEVALLQLELLNSIPHPDWTVEVGLHSRLYSLTTLFLEYSEPLGLPSISLQIIHLAGHPDPVLVARLWQRLLAPQEPDLTLIPGKLEALAAKIYPSDEVAMPLGYLVDMLALVAFKSSESETGRMIQWFKQTWSSTVVPWARVQKELESLRSRPSSFWSASPERKSFIDKLIR